MNLALSIASALSLLTLAIHLLAGHRYVVVPLLEVPGLSRASRWLSYFCWHAVSVTLSVLVLGFAWAAARNSPDIAILLLILCGLYSLLSYAVVLKGGLRPWRIAPCLLFPLITLAAAFGVSQ